MPESNQNTLPVEDTAKQPWMTPELEAIRLDSTESGPDTSEGGGFGS